MATKKHEMMLELEALVLEKSPRYANNIHAALFGILCAVIKEEDIQKAIDLWSSMDEEDKEEI